MPTVKVKGGSVHYSVRGEGAPLVMVRGLGRSQRHWLGFDRKLAEDFQVITLDLRGVGRSRCEVAWHVTVTDLAGDVTSVLDDLGIQSAHVLGVSLGGMVGLACAVSAPGRVKSLTVINSSIRGSGVLRLSVAGLWALISGCFLKESLQRRLCGVLVARKSAKERERIIKQWNRIAASEQLVAGNVVKHLFAAVRFGPAAHLRGLGVPTLVLCGSKDAFVSNKNSLHLHGLIPGALLEVIEGGGHELTMDYPDEVHAVLLKFIATLNDNEKHPMCNQSAKTAR